MSKIEVGKQYDVIHRRKGNFKIRVITVEGATVTGIILEGKAKYLSEANRLPGDTIELPTDRRWIELIPAGH